MHLGRFTFVVDFLERHFKEAKLPEQIEAAAVALEQYNQGRVETQQAEFRAKLDAALESSDELPPELLQPYAHQVIADLGLGPVLPPAVRSTVDKLVAHHGFDGVGLAAALKKQAKSFATRINWLLQLDACLRGLSAERTEVEPGRAEFGLLLPREAVGERLPDLSKEFDKLSNLARAANELTGQPDYDSRVVTISSSWWQVFLDVPVEQIVFWTVAVERIVALFKTNLEIKKLQRDLGEHQMSESIIKAISDEVDKKVSVELESIASDLVKEFGKIDDRGRLNEVQTQLRQGLHYLARRMNQGAQVELNVGVPDDPEDDPEAKDGVEPDPELLTANRAARERIAHLRTLRVAAMNASETSLQIDRAAPLLLEEIKQPDAST
jgi:hypothetical protein